MIATIPVDLLFCALCGLVLAHSARVLIRAHSGTFFECAALRVAGLFLAIVVWPSALYLYLAHPDWSWMYWVDPRLVPRLTVVLLLLGYGGALGGGFALGYGLVRAGKFTQLLLAIAGAVVLVGLVVGLGHQRFFHWGTFDDFQSHLPMYTLAEVKLGYALVVVALATGSALAYTCWQLYRAGRRIS